jgi:uncharacterized membrane protein YoaK (UPF0700 family)
VIARLPGWVWGGAWVLAFGAGMVNVVGLLGFQHQAITHLTGNTSLLAAAMVHGDARASVQLLMLVAAFVGGAALSGAIIQDATLQLGRPYGIAMFLVAILLGASVPLLERHRVWGMYTAAAGCGLQNAMASTFSGFVVRTTHVSGMFTDLGIGLGHALRRRTTNARRLMLSVTVITAFFAGGIAGASAFATLAYDALYVPAGLALIVATTYAVFKRAPGTHDQ